MSGVYNYSPTAYRPVLNDAILFCVKDSEIKYITYVLMDKFYDNKYYTCIVFKSETPLNQCDRRDNDIVLG